jgi:integrase
VSGGKRRSRGDGSVFFDASRGCWVGVLDIGREPETGRRRRRKVSAPTKTECKDLLDELREEKRKSGTVAPRDITVEHVIRDLLANPPRTWRSPTTIQVNTDHAGRIITAIGKTRMVRLGVADVEKFLRKLADDGYSTSVIGATKRIGSRAVRRAMRDGLAGRDVFELAELQDGTRRQSRSMTLAQIRTLLASDLTPFWRAYLVVGICCGLRPGERTGLVWDDIDLVEGVIRVRHSLKALPGPDGHLVLQLAELKTEKSRRTLALPRYAVAALKALKTAQAADKLRLGPLYRDQGLVFCRPDGGPYWREAIRLGFRRVCKLAGIGEDWTPRELRHSFVSVLSDAGVDIEDIADAAGHSSSTVTREVYRHQISDKVARAAEAMDRIFGAGGAS